MSKNVGIVEEIWKDVKDFENLYQVSNLTNVKNKITGQILRPGLSGEGYYTVALYKNGKAYTKPIHRLVAEAFIPRPNDSMIINHIDGDKTNNSIYNLEWVTYGENIRHAYDHGLNNHRKPVRIIETGEVFDSLKDCAKAINGHNSNIHHCLTGKINSHKGLHFERVDADEKRTTKKPFLYPHQKEAISKMRNGCILNGGVGSGKSRTGIYYYFNKYGGSIEDGEYIPMRLNPKPPDLYIISTPKKRDDKEFELELAPFLLSTDEKRNAYYGNKVTIDSWQNIKKYSDITGAFFIFDEDKVTGSGAWVKAFLKIAKNNEWIILSATAGDVWMDYVPVFIANGFYRNRTDFNQQHVVYARYAKFPKVDRYINTGRLIRLRERVLVDMDFERHTVPHHEDVYTNYDRIKYKDVIRTRWDPYRDEPIQQAAGLCYILRRIVNEDESRQLALLEIFEKHPKMIVFYSFDYERDILLNLAYGDDVEIAEWSGHAHQDIPNSDKWVYLCQYTSACEGFNCTKTDTIVFYSQTYSYKTLAQAEGRINRLNTPFTDLYYYNLKSRSGIDLAISKALHQKKKFNERKFCKWE